MTKRPCAVRLCAAFLLLAGSRIVMADLPPRGACFAPQSMVTASSWPDAVHVDERAEFVIPVNVVRVFSDEHAAEQIAPRKWILAQLQVANKLYAFEEAEMRAYSASRPAPCLQFTLNEIVDIHEREVSEILGFELDTENVYGAAPAENGVQRVGTKDLRSLKVTDGAQYATVYCVWDIKNPLDDTSSIGGESNVGFADCPPTGPRRKLVKVTATRARMGVVTARREAAWMNNFAHELGHFFCLIHAWEHQRNAELFNIRDLGSGPMGNVDSEKEFANVMDYENGPGVKQYFAKSQMDVMYRFCRDRATQEIAVVRKAAGPDTGAPPVVAPPVASLAARIRAVRVDDPAPGGDAEVIVTFDVSAMKGVEGSLVAWFSDGAGAPLMDADGVYRSGNGQVSVGAGFTPGYEETTFNDFRLKLPAGQTHLGPGQHDCSVIVGVFGMNKPLAVSDKTAFRYAVPAAPPELSGGGMAAWVLSAVVDPPVMHNNEPWIRLRSEIRADNLQGQTLLVQARFFLPDGRPLLDFDGQYAAPDRLAMAQAEVVPQYPQAVIHDMTVWIPVAQLHLAPGIAQVSARLTVLAQGRALASWASALFPVVSGGAPPPRFETPAVRPPTAPEVKASAVVNKLWIVHNRRRGNDTGLEVHATVSINGCRGRSCAVGAWFWAANGARLLDFDRQYAVNGQVYANVVVTPDYDVATFPDVAVFIPYDQLHLSKGTHNLGASVSVYLDQTELGRSSGITGFQLSRR